MFSGSNTNLVNLSASLQSLLASFDKNLKITIDGETLVGVEFDELKEGELEKDSPAFVVSKLEDSLILWSYGSFYIDQELRYMLTYSCST